MWSLLLVFACWSNQLANCKRPYQAQYMFDLYTHLFHQTFPRCSNDRVHSFPRLVLSYHPGRLPHLHTTAKIVDKRARGTLREYNGSICVTGGVGCRTGYGRVLTAPTHAVQATSYKASQNRVGGHVRVGTLHHCCRGDETCRGDPDRLQDQFRRGPSGRRLLVHYRVFRRYHCGLRNDTTSFAGQATRRLSTQPQFTWQNQE